jgi:hypothetical protein
MLINSDIIPIEFDRFRSDSVVGSSQNPITGIDRFRPSEIIGSVWTISDSDIRTRSGSDHRNFSEGTESDKIRFGSFHLGIQSFYLTVNYRIVIKIYVLLKCPRINKIQTSVENSYGSF